MLSTLLRTFGRTIASVSLSAIFGELSFAVVCVAGMVYSPFATFFVFVLPFFACRFFMMWGNWAQHVSEELFNEIWVIVLLVCADYCLRVCSIHSGIARQSAILLFYIVQAFIDQSRPESSYVNSITCINTYYNRTCFNDGYHIGQ